MNGLDCFMEGFSLVREPGVRKFVIVPAMINTVVLILLVSFSVSRFDSWVQQIMGYLPEWLSFLESLVWFLAVVTAIFVLFYLFTIVANIIASPFNAVLSEKVEEKVTGKPVVSELSVWQVVPRAVGREVSKLLYLLPRLFGLLLISIIPVVNTVAPILWLVFGAWMMAIQYTDYAADNNEVSFKELRARLGRHRISSVMFGLPAYLVLAIPLVNLILMPVAVAGATLFWVKNLGSE